MKTNLLIEDELLALGRCAELLESSGLLVPPDRMPELRALLDHARESPSALSTSLRRPDGESVAVQLSASRREIAGRPHFIVTADDPAGEAEAAVRLAASEEKYRNLVENLVDVAWVSRLSDGKLLFMSQNILGLSGYTAEEIMQGGKALFDGRIHLEDVDTVQVAQAGLFKTGKMDVEHRWQHRDGTWRWCRVRARVATRAGLEVVEGLVSDITEHKRLADDYRQAQKMEAIGHLTGGVAHDFNNLLCVILAGSDALLRTLPEFDELREDAANIREAGERAAALTRQLLAFSRKQVLRPRLLDLSAVVKGVEKLLRRVIGEDIVLTLSSDEAPVWVHADASQLEQVLFNLAVNARDAMPSGGALTVETRGVEVGAKQHAPVRPGRYAQLKVSDTGCGMSTEVQTRIFEPFFTTKPIGKGTGMGLSTCYGIVTQSGGHIEVHSEPGDGACFSVWLPAVTPDEVAPTEEVGMKPRGGKETVLLVEDDDPLRRTIQRMLARLGYAVLAARDGEQAEALYRQHRETISLVLSDVVMPGKSGLETIAQMRAEQFTGKVLFMSGHTDRPALEAALCADRATFIHKPFEREVLARTVREVIDGVVK